MMMKEDIFPPPMIIPSASFRISLVAPASFDIVLEDIEAGKKIPLADIGSGVYPTTIFFNHSCAPNTVRINQGPRVSNAATASYTVWGIRLLENRFCIMFPESSTGRLAVLQLLCCPSKQGELKKHSTKRFSQPDVPDCTSSTL